MNMSRAGRKRKAGKRYASGDLIVSRVDRGSADLRLQRADACGKLGVEARVKWLAGKSDEAIELVANDCSEGLDAIGRAWVAGLLEVDGKAPEHLLAAGRKLADLYWDEYRELAARSSRYGASGGGFSGTYPIERDKSVNRQLNARMEALARLGRDVSAAVDSLCLGMDYDAGPAWLDRLIVARRDKAVAYAYDLRMLANALVGLGALA